MKWSRSLLVWATLALCGVMVLGAMTWLTRGVLASEKERALAEARADLEERTRLALWRMDAVGSAILLRENRHHPDDYDPLSDAFGDATNPEVLLHFSVSKGGTITSPELQRSSTATKKSLEPKEEGTSAILRPIRRNRETLDTIILGGHLKRLCELLKANPMPGDEWALLNNAAEQGESAWQALPKDAPQEMKENTFQRQNKQGDDLRNSASYQNNSNSGERAQRAKALAQAVDSATPPVQNPGHAPAPGSQAITDQQSGRQVFATRRTVAEAGQFRAVWLGGELFLLRQTVWNLYQTDGLVSDNLVFKGNESSIEGVWFKLPELRQKLLREVADLMPKADLVAVQGQQAVSDPLTLVSFPFRLLRNEASPSLRSSINGPLLIGWVAVLLALLTASLLVHGVMRLSERRASFVSAVTHELRTPLTTFRLYSDMLESGAVKPEKRGDYLRVLSREADRLSHLVENVLSFSKIERGSARSVVRESTVADLLEPMRERLEARLATAGMTLEMDTACPLRVRVDNAAVEHILFNLIDNAAKYASAGDPRKVEIQVRPADRHVEIAVSDHGPGIPASERRRIFRAFHKSAREAAESRPGVGLGLALSRRLAKSLGGGLECVDSAEGACFVLRLPQESVPAVSAGSTPG